METYRRTRGQLVQEEIRRSIDENLRLVDTDDAIQQASLDTAVYKIPISSRGIGFGVIHTTALAGSEQIPLFPLYRVSLFVLEIKLLHIHQREGYDSDLPQDLLTLARGVRMLPSPIALVINAVETEITDYNKFIPYQPQMEYEDPEAIIPEGGSIDVLMTGDRVSYSNLDVVVSVLSNPEANCQKFIDTCAIPGIVIEDGNLTNADEIKCGNLVDDLIKVDQFCSKHPEICSNLEWANPDTGSILSCSIMGSLRISGGHSPLASALLGTVTDFAYVDVQRPVLQAALLGEIHESDYSVEFALRRRLLEMFQHTGDYWNLLRLGFNP